MGEIKEAEERNQQQREESRCEAIRDGQVRMRMEQFKTGEEKVEERRIAGMCAG